MSYKKAVVFILIGLFGFGHIYDNRLIYKVLEITDYGNGSKNIFRISCETNCTTMFVLPKGETIADIIEPTGNWVINCDNRRFVYVVPMRKGIHTSLDLITKSSKIYSFILEEISKSGSGDGIIKKVLIRNLTRFKDSDKKGKYQDKSSKMVPKENPSNGRYKIKGKYFKIEKVEDNGILTRIYIGKSQVRPAVFIKKRGRRSGFEPVRYVDNGEILTVHRVIGKGESIILKKGKYESIVRRK